MKVLTCLHNQHSTVLATSMPRDQLWFNHPEMRARIARAERDFAEGRSIRTHTLAEAQAFLDGLKNLPLTAGHPEIEKPDDAETRFRSRAALGSPEEGLRILDELNRRQ